ncbi:MAG: hypothetical protein PHG00_06285 [Methylococcales bacterium]|nr:hypothetical protein [Methylococcales bacterium]
MNNLNTLKNQNGAATLLTALVLLIGITLITLLSSKTVLMETQIAADNYRMTQAVAAANAALDFGIGYFNGVDNAGTVIAGFDHDHNKCPDYLSDPLSYLDPTTNTNVNCAATSPRALTFTSNDGNQVTTATVTFDNDDGTRCVAVGAVPNMKSGLITAVGFSDDRLAQRTVSQCIGTIDVFGGNSPKQSLISRNGVGLTGNYKMINRYFNTTAWSGKPVNIGPSATASTYIRPIGTQESSYTRAQLDDSNTNNNYTSQPISDRNKGNGVDTIANDPSLGTLSGDQFFNNFFYGDRMMMKNLAESLDQSYTNIDSAIGKSGVVWIEGNATLNNNGTYGTADSPVIIIINGNLQATGNPNINGMLYVRGQLNAAGTIGTLGSVTVEGDPSLVPAGEDPVIGHGGVDLIYSPYTLDRSANPIVGTTTSISGSWRDW